MTKESISSKISELFDLYKSGAISKAEYKKLKEKILSEDVIENIENGEKQEQINRTSSDKPIRVRKGLTPKTNGLILSVVFIFVVFCILLYLFSNKSGVAGLQTHTVKDIDGNVYLTVTIGKQVWMAENLKTTKYNDGIAIPLVTDDNGWGALTTPAYCWYNNDAIANKKRDGALYNWFAVNTKKLCPTGWHVPLDTEWTTLQDYLSKNGYSYGGIGSNIAKSLAATTGWAANGTANTVGNDQSSNNKSGFMAYPSGHRYLNGTFFLIGLAGHWWSSSDGSISSAYYRYISYLYGDLISNFYNKQEGFSVRCVLN
jgi:uncharacterized protein (TIGR02145 family)